MKKINKDDVKISGLTSCVVTLACTNK